MKDSLARIRKPKGSQLLRLFLLRHAKSDWGNPALDDIDRPLNARGRSAAQTMASYLVAEDLLPEHILCSVAQRTRETLAHLVPALDHSCQVELRKDLYLQNEGNYLSIVRAFGGSVRNLLIIGHNPAIEDTAQQLIGAGDKTSINALETKYPSGALTVIDFEVDSWGDIARSGGRLERFVKPRDLHTSVD